METALRALITLSLLLSVAATPAAAASSPDLMTVEQQLANLVSTRSGDFGIAAVDLATGRNVSINSISCDADRPPIRSDKLRRP